MATYEKELPDWYQTFKARHPEIELRYRELGAAIHESGPLNDRDRALAKLAISGVSENRQAYRRHIRRARDLGISRAEIEHVAILSLTTCGFPQMMAQLYIVNEEFEKTL